MLCLGSNEENVLGIRVIRLIEQSERPRVFFFFNIGLPSSLQTSNRIACVYTTRFVWGAYSRLTLKSNATQPEKYDNIKKRSIHLHTHLNTRPKIAATQTNSIAFTDASRTECVSGCVCACSSSVSRLRVVSAHGRYTRRMMTMMMMMVHPRDGWGRSRNGRWRDQLWGCVVKIRTHTLLCVSLSPSSYSAWVG